MASTKTQTQATIDHFVPFAEDPRPGELAMWAVGGDEYPARVLVPPTMGKTDVRPPTERRPEAKGGIEGIVVKLAVERLNLQGEKYLKLQWVLADQVFQRPTGMTSSIDDLKTVPEILTQYGKRFGAFIASRANRGQTAAVQEAVPA